MCHEILLFGVEGIKTAVHEVVSGSEAGRIKFGLGRQERMKIMACAEDR